MHGTQWSLALDMQRNVTCSALLMAAHGVDEMQVYGSLPILSTVGHGAVGLHPAVFQV